MEKQLSPPTSFKVTSLEELAPISDYSFMDSLNCDPDANPDSVNRMPRQVFTGHYVPVMPTPIEAPEYVAHSKSLFRELGFADSLAQSPDFMRIFSGDLSQVPEPLRRAGWACGYALSIYGTEYIQQCPFQTGNGYGDGRAISVLEASINGRRWEMQLKGGGRTPYCRGPGTRRVPARWTPTSWLQSRSPSAPVLHHHSFGWASLNPSVVAPANRNIPQRWRNSNSSCFT